MFLFCLFWAGTWGAPSQAGQAGSLDEMFNAGEGINPVNTGNVNKIGLVELAPDGAIYVAGNFEGFNSHPTPGIARLFPNGEVDPNFVAFRGTQVDLTSGGVTSLALTHEGKILAGYFERSTGLPSANWKVDRLLADGTIDETFETPFSNGPHRSRAYQTIVVLPDGKMLVTGLMYLEGSQPVKLARLNPDHTLDSTFQPFASSATSIVQIVPLSEGGLLARCAKLETDGTIRFSALRFLADGTNDESFAWPSSLDQRFDGMAVQPDGKIILFRSFPQDSNERALVRLHQDGAVDTAFQPDAAVLLGVNTLAIQRNGQILAGARGSIPGGIQKLVLLKEDGSLDPDFSFPLKLSLYPSIHAILVHPDGGIIVAGNFQDQEDPSRRSIVRLHGRDEFHFSAILHLPGPVLRGSVWTRPGKTYVLQSTDSLQEPVWKTVQTLNGEGSRQSFQDENMSAPRGFYRVRIESP